MATVIMSMNPILAGLGMAGLWATQVSSASALLLASTQLVNNDLLLPIKKNVKPDVKRDAIVSRIVLIILGVITTILAFTVKSMISFAITVLCISPAFFWAVLGLMYFPKLLKKHSAIITLIVSLVFFALWIFVPAIKTAIPTPIYFEWPLCTVVFWLVNLIEKAPIEKLPELDPTID